METYDTQMTVTFEDSVKVEAFQRNECDKWVDVMVNRRNRSMHIGSGLNTVSSMYRQQKAII